MNEYNSTRFYVDNSFIIETEKAIGLYPMRSDGVKMPKPVYFPKSIISYKRMSNCSRIVISNTILKSKLMTGYTIFTGV